MRRFFKKDFKKDMPVSTPGFAAGITGMAKALEEMEVVGGRVEWSSRNIPRLIIGGRNGGDAVGPFDISLTATEATFRKCYTMRGPVTKVHADIEGLTLPELADCYAALKYDTEADTVTVVFGAGIADVTAASLPTPEDSRYFYQLLYRLAKPTGATVWGVAEKHFAGIPIIPYYS